MASQWKKSRGVFQIHPKVKSDISKVIHVFWSWKQISFWSLQFLETNRSKISSNHKPWLGSQLELEQRMTFRYCGIIEPSLDHECQKYFCGNGVSMEEVSRCVSNSTQGKKWYFKSESCELELKANVFLIIAVPCTTRSKISSNHKPWLGSALELEQRVKFW